MSNRQGDEYGYGYGYAYASPPKRYGRYGRPLDRALSKGVYDWCRASDAMARTTMAMCRLLEWSGDGRLWLAICAICGIWVFRSEERGERREFDNLLALLVLLVLDLLAVGTIKWTVKRPRPTYGLGTRPRDDYVVHVDRFSFPSGHASRSMAIAALATTLQMTSARPLWIWTLLVGISRVACGRHHATDVLAGWALGIALGIGTHRLVVTTR
jgi:hypothetical protein